MGAGQSTRARTVTLDNPNSPSVIDVSDEVVQRLKDGLRQQAKEKAAAQKATPAATPPPTPPKPAPTAKKAPAIAAAAPAPPTIIYGNQAPVYSPAIIGATLSAAEVHRQKEIELRENDALWRQRLAQLEQTLNKTNIVLEKEYADAVENVRQRFATAAPIHQLPPCQNLKAQIIACYRAHPGETLKCADEVAAFRSCVSANRIQKLDAEVVQPKTAPAASAA